MFMKTPLVRLMFALWLCFPFMAQAADKVFIEADPIAYALKGYSLHGGVEMEGFRFQVGAFGLDVPDVTSNNTNYKLRQTGVGFKIDYFGSSDKGGFVGVEYGATQVVYTLASANFTDTRPANLAGIRIGYKYVNRSGFYVMPWVGVDKNISDISPINPAGEKYDVSEYLIFPTVHLGVQF
jgi:hypothetical protein